MAEFLLELFSEEIPARMQVKAAADLKDLFIKSLTEKGLPFTTAAAHSTPRRITIVVDGLPEQQPDIAVEKRGPRADAPQQAVDGFLKANNLANLDKCTKEETPKGAFWFYRETVKGQATADILEDDIVPNILRTLPWPKSMRWAGSSFQWVRPLRSVIALFNKKTFKKSFRLSSIDIPCSDKTYGHRFLSPEEIVVTNFADYKTKLKNAHVLLDRAERKDIIGKQAQALANKENLTVKEDEALLEEIVGLVEWPVPLVATFEKEYLEVPQEVLISTMRGNQKYIALLDKSGKLSNKFIVIANTEALDGGKQIIAGNEKVLRARLSDAKFFWDQDKKQKLESRNAALDQITFHKKLGTVKDKVARLQALSQNIADMLGYDAALAARAALLSKADLTSGVVYQFPEVQGIMGRYYALHDHEPVAVANAISDHYKPVGANDSCPTAPVSLCVALADKIDTLVGFFAIDEKPTGSKDPFALRRAALGVIRIILENKLRLPLNELFGKSYQLYQNKVSGLAAASTVSHDLMQFFIERLKVTLKDQGIRFDLIDAVFAAPVKNDDLNEVSNLAIALKDFISSDNGANLLTAYKRAVNILKIEEKKDGRTYTGDVNEHILEPAEQALVQALSTTSDEMDIRFQKKDFTGCMSAMADMRKPVDSFFEKIMVNAPEPDIRVNRLCLLSQLRDTMNVIADFSKIEG